MRSRVQPGSFPTLFVTLMLQYVVNGVAVDVPANASLVGRVAVACAGLYVLSASRTTLWLGVLVLALWLTLETHLWPPDPLRRVVLDTITTGFFLWVLVVVLREIFRPRTSEVNAVVGALCGFLLILMAFANVHGLIEALRPESYR